MATMQRKGISLRPRKNSSSSLYERNNNCPGIFFREKNNSKSSSSKSENLLKRLQCENINVYLPRRKVRNDSRCAFVSNSETVLTPFHCETDDLSRGRNTNFSQSSKCNYIFSNDSPPPNTSPRLSVRGTPKFKDSHAALSKPSTKSNCIFHERNSPDSKNVHTVRFVNKKTPSFGENSISSPSSNSRITSEFSPDSVFFSPEKGVSPQKRLPRSLYLNFDKKNGRLKEFGSTIPLTFDQLLKSKTISLFENDRNPPPVRPHSADLFERKEQHLFRPIFHDHSIIRRSSQTSSVLKPTFCKNRGVNLCSSLKGDAMESGVRSRISSRETSSFKRVRSFDI